MALLKKICLPFGCLLIVFGAVLSATNTVASTIVFSSTENNDPKLIASPPVDMLVPSISNTDGNSYTKLTRFTVDRPLKIINTANTHGSISNKPARLIIIDASSVDLRSNIEIVGETADLLIINSTTSGYFSCASCSFANVGRATLATATVSFDSLKNPGNITPVSSNLIVNGLSTDRVASMELIGKSISLNGLINTQTRGSRLSDGSYQLNPGGGLIIGAGGVNVFSGFIMDYPTLGVGAPQVGSSLSINSSTQIASQAVHISTAAAFNMVGTITTKSDVATAVNYRGKLSAIEESVKIYSFSSSGELTIGGGIYSDNLVDVRSSSGLIFNGNIQAAGLIGIAGKDKKIIHKSVGAMVLSGYAARWQVSRAGNSDITQAAECVGDRPVDSAKANLCLSAFFSAGSIDNNGAIKGRRVVMAAINELQNRYGGKILADNIQLSSQYGFIRNGSKYPFKPVEDQPQIFAPIDPNNIPLGTVTIDGAPFLAAQNGATKVDTTAFIIGKNITIVASGNVENINPYMELTTDSESWRKNGVAFSPTKAARVQILAENYLKIGSSSYLLNSSAYMGVGSPNGNFFVSSPSIANQRYTTQAVVQPYSRTENSVTTTGTESALLVYSPPGVIYSFSPLTFNLGATGNFINNTSYFEVLNDAEVNSVSQNSIVNIGLNVSGVVNTSVNNLYISCVSAIKIVGSNEAAGRQIAAEMEKCNRLYGGTTVAPGTIVEAQQGTLFSVKGNFKGDKSAFLITNHDVMAEMKNKVISDYIQAHSGVNARVGTGTKTEVSTGATISYGFTEAMRLSADGNYFLTEKVVTSRSNSGCRGSAQFCQNMAAVNSVDSSWSESVAQVLADAFKKMKDFLIECITALKNLLS